MALNDDYAYLNGVSAHPKRAGDTSSLNPAFATPLANAIRQARAEGLNVGLESGFRAPGQTGSAYDAGGNSSHSYGLAGDVSGLDGANGKVTQRWAQIAEANGLHNPYGVGDAAEFNHWQLPPQPLEQNPKLLSSLKTASASGDIHNVWSAYNSGGGPSRPGSPTPGTTINSSPMDIVLQAESGNRNIANTHATTSSGQAQGYPQITTGTWNEFAPKVGVDLNQYPNPLSAPRDVQIKVASAIPLNRWASSTVNAVLAKYPGIDTSQTLGSIQSAAINPSGASTTAAGGPPASAATGQPGQASGGLAGQLATALKPLSGGKGAAGDGGQADEPKPMQLAQAPMARAVGGPMMIGPGGMNAPKPGAQDVLAQLAASSAARPPVAPIMPGQATGIAGLPGTTLNSPSQMQMALMTGSMSPYDMYANNAAYGGGFGSM